MSLEDAKKRLQDSQDRLQVEQGRRDQAFNEQTEIETELSRMIGEAVTTAIYGQDAAQDQLRKELHVTNENYRLLHGDIVRLTDILKDTSNLQEAYDIKRRELEREYEEEEKALKKKLDAQKHTHEALLKAEQMEYDAKKQEWAKLKSALNKENREEELKLRNSISSIKGKKMAIIIGVIALFVVGFLLGLMLAYNGGVTSNTPY